LGEWRLKLSDNVSVDFLTILSGTTISGTTISGTTILGTTGEQVLLGEVLEAQSIVVIISSS
jgi:hypothetical protein